MEVKQAGKRFYKAWAVPGFFDDKSREQVEMLANVPFVKPWVAVMPDVHYGTGSCVGTVIPMLGAIIPAAVGVDGGCGMIAIRTNLSKEFVLENRETIFEAIGSLVPMGRSTDDRGRPVDDIGAWKKFSGLPKICADSWEELAPGYETLLQFRPEIANSNTWQHIGTLGTGNHFLELSEDEYDRIWIVIHSGSRGVGNRIGTVFCKLAKQEMERRHTTVQHPDLSFFTEGDRLYDQYEYAMNWVQDYARTNRLCMAHMVMEYFGDSDAVFRHNLTEEERIDPKTGAIDPPARIQCHHNYARKENHFGMNPTVVRKGAIRAGLGDWGIIPGSMGAATYIVRGLGNPDSFCSASHGAGRAIGRRQARDTFSASDLIAQTNGIVCRKDEDVIDEIPSAYKPIDLVMAAQDSLVEKHLTLKQLICWKG